MKLLMSISIVLMLLSYQGTSFGSGETIIGSYPLPLAESEVLFTRWLQQEKYTVVSNVLFNGDIELRGAAAEKLIRVLIRSRSPLATEIRLQETSAISDTARIRLSWELFLAKMGQVEALTFPEVIRTLSETVVCISAPTEFEKKINFSGFFIDQEGTVLTIAHDIDQQQVFRLQFAGGGVGEGRVVKSDAAKDLSVIQSEQRAYRKFLSLKKGRTKLNFGDRVFMLCCSSNGSIQIQSGTVDKPKASVSGHQLWQVKLEKVFLGSSGSPVVDESGRLVGVVKGRFKGTDSHGFLIPLDTVRAFVGMGKK